MVAWSGKVRASMKPRRTPDSTTVFFLGGNEDNDLWLKQGSTDGEPWLESVWELTDRERGEVTAGATIVLRTWGTGTPPLALFLGPSMQERRA